MISFKDEIKKHKLPLGKPIKMETQKRTIDTTNIFTNGFLDPQALYMYLFGQPPCSTWINDIDTKKSLELLQRSYSEDIADIYQNSEYNRKKGKPVASTTIVVLREKCMVVLKNDYCDILHGAHHQTFATALIKVIGKCKRREKRRPFEINIIIKSGIYLELKPMEIIKTKLDLHLFYNDDFTAVDALIKKRLLQKKNKGIVLLHGLPGTGKTTYLRYLIGNIKKKVLFISPSVAQCIMEPDFMELLIDNPDCILVIEDAENIIMDRRGGGDSSVSNLLNISDGLLADFLNVQVICTFNSSVAMVDGALMRKGRLIANYEFGKLSTDKSQRLSNQLGFKTVIKHPMTVAEITNQHERQFETKAIQVLGFRRDAVLEN